MKIKLTVILMALFSLASHSSPNTSWAQRSAYSESGKKRYKTEDARIEFTKSEVIISGPEIAAAALVAGTVDLAFKIGTDILERRKAKFSAEYVLNNSYLDANLKQVPGITYVRKIDNEVALKIELKPKKIEGLDYFVYYVHDIELKYSKAKTTKRSKVFDYTIELKPTFIVNGKKETQEISPIVVRSVGFGSKRLPEKYENHRYRSSFVTIPMGGIFTGVSVKIVETNPAKIRAEKILSIFNTYKDDAKSIINNIIKKDDDSEDNNEKDPNQSTGN